MHVFRNPIIQMKNSNLSRLHFLIDYMVCICRSPKAISVSDAERMLLKKLTYVENVLLGEMWAICSAPVGDLTKSCHQIELSSF